MHGNEHDKKRKTYHVTILPEEPTHHGERIDCGVWGLDGEEVLVLEAAVSHDLQTLSIAFGDESTPVKLDQVLMEWKHCSTHSTSVSRFR